MYARTSGGAGITSFMNESVVDFVSSLARLLDGPWIKTPPISQKAMTVTKTLKPPPRTESKVPRRARFATCPKR
jgi:hypothetical protein